MTCSLAREHHAHGCTAFVTFVSHRSVVREWRGSSPTELAIAHEKLDFPIVHLMVDEAAALAGLRGGCIPEAIKLSA